jgi:hypothetical protein
MVVSARRSCLMAGWATVLAAATLALAPVSQASADGDLTLKGAPGAGPARFDQIFVHRFGPAEAATALILLPSGNSGAGSDTLVARDLVAAVPDLQVWTVDFRWQALEDTSVFATGDPGAAFAYYLGFQQVASIQPGLPLISKRSAQRSLDLLRDGDPFAFLLKGLPVWAPGVFLETGALYALTRPQELSALQSYPLLPHAFVPPVRVTNQAHLTTRWTRHEPGVLRGPARPRRPARGEWRPAPLAGRRAHSNRASGGNLRPGTRERCELVLAEASEPRPGRGSRSGGQRRR